MISSNNCSTSRTRSMQWMQKMELINYQSVEIRQDELIVLKDVDLSIQSGEFVYLLGRVGSGKSSLMKTFYAELPVYAGSANFLGYDLTKLRTSQIPYLRRKIGVVFQDFQLLPCLLSCLLHLIDIPSLKTLRHFYSSMCCLAGSRVILFKICMFKFCSLLIIAYKMFMYLTMFRE